MRLPIFVIFFIIASVETYFFGPTLGLIGGILLFGLMLISRTIDLPFLSRSQPKMEASPESKPQSVFSLEVMVGAYKFRVHISLTVEGSRQIHVLNLISNEEYWRAIIRSLPPIEGSVKEITKKLEDELMAHVLRFNNTVEGGKSGSRLLATIMVKPSGLIFPLRPSSERWNVIDKPR